VFIEGGQEALPPHFFFKAGTAPVDTNRIG
jgi:hypothetical protein